MKADSVMSAWLLCLLLLGGMCGCALLGDSYRWRSARDAPNDPSRAGDVDPQPRVEPAIEPPLDQTVALAPDTKPAPAAVDVDQPNAKPEDDNKTAPPNKPPMKDGDSPAAPVHTTDGHGDDREIGSDTGDDSPVNPPAPDKPAAKPADKPAEEPPVPPTKDSKPDKPMPAPNEGDKPPAPDAPGKQPAPDEDEAHRKAVAAWMAGSAYNRLFDVKGMTMREGTVEVVDTFVPGKGALEGLRLKIATKDGPVAVHIGPRVFVLDSDIRFNYQDSVRIVGCIAKFGDSDVLIAGEVRKGEETLLKLRDDMGRPLWTADRLRDTSDSR